MAYNINYNDERFQKVEAEKNDALQENEKLYGDMVNETDKFYQAQIDASKEWAETQQKNQQAQTDFAIEKIEQQKEQAHKDYLKEQKGAYTDWQKQSNRYGVNAEQMASQGLTNSGYSESSQVAIYTAYQNRVASARESIEKTKLNFDNAINEAKLQNNTLLAEIAIQAQKEQLELALAGFQYKNQLLLDKADKKTQILSRFDNRYQAVLDQLNTENALQEEVRQFNANHALNAREIALAESKFNYQKEQDAKAEEEARLLREAKAQQSVYTYNGSSKATGQGAAALDRKNSRRESGQGVNRESLTVDTDSLNRCAKLFGLKTLTAAQANNFVEQGVLNDSIENGKIVFTVNMEYAKKKYLPQTVRKTFGLKG